MILLYNLSIQMYVILIKIFSLFNQKAKFWVDGRKNWQQNLSENISKSDKVIWFHAASLGEFEQGRPLIEKIKIDNPEYKILLTFFSPSGYEVRKNYDGADYICYLPADTKANARKFVDIVSPEKVYFIKYEFWHHYLNELKKRNVNTYVISAIFRVNQIFFKWYGGFHRKILTAFTHFFVQNEMSKDLLNKIGFSEVSVVGDTRFDRVAELAKEAKELPIVEKFKQGKQILIAGSTWPKDEEILVKYINESDDKVKFIIAPHEVDESHVVKILSGIKKSVVRYTQADEETISESQVLVVDCIGVLSSMYRYGELAYIGGGFGVGIHNTLEAATYGMPILFGPNYAKFQEAKDLISLNAAFSYSIYNDFEQKFTQLFSDSVILKNTSKNASNYVDKNIGACSQILLKTF